MTRVYRLALHLLPHDLRNAHGSAMEELFAREIEEAGTRGWMFGRVAGAAGIWDVLKRAVYERARPIRGSEGVPPLSNSDLLRRLGASFVIAFAALTLSLLFLYGNRQVPLLVARGASVGTIAQFLLLSVPFTAAMTIPMAVLLSVLHEFTRLGASGALATIGSEVRRLVVTVLAAAVGVAVLSLVVTAEIVPRANERLAGVLSGAPVARSDRTMTISELREAARNATTSTEPVTRARVAAYEVEVQKKFALPAACLVLAMAGMAIAFTFPRGGVWLVLGASVVVFGAYYAMIMTGESLAESLVVSPVVGMWGANAVLLTVALLAVWRRSGVREAAAFE